MRTKLASYSKSSHPEKGGVSEGRGGMDNSSQPLSPLGSSPCIGELLFEKRKKLNNLQHLKTYRKTLRNDLIPAVTEHWKLLKGKKLNGRKFRRQYSVGNYILDFYCPSEKIAIELDGQYHFNPSQAEYNKEKDLFLKHFRIQVFCIENKIIWKNPEQLINQIRS